MKFQTRPAPALEMRDACGGLLPHGGVTGDAEMGRCGPWRTRDERDLLAIPSNTLFREAEIAPSEYSGRGRPPKTPWQRVDPWCGSLPETAWTTLDERDGEQGPLEFEVPRRRVQARTRFGITRADGQWHSLY